LTQQEGEPQSRLLFFPRTTGTRKEGEYGPWSISFRVQTVKKSGLGLKKQLKKKVKPRKKGNQEKDEGREQTG
jgi:hypothetical protein